MSNQYLSFDVTKQSAPQQLITGRQGDSQLKFVTMLFWDGDKNVPYDLTGKQVAFEAIKPDNTHIVDYEGITVLDAPAGLVRYSFNEQVFSVAGTMQQAFFKITHTDSDNNVIADSTLEVAINILENRVEFGINSKDYLSEYDNLIAQVEKKFDDYAATVQDSIDKAQALHDQIVEYTNLINSKGVILRSEFGDISSIKQPLGQTVVDKLNNEFNDRGVNVKWFGAVGDGVTDDTDAFRQALANVHDTAVSTKLTSNPRIIVPAGTYKVSDTLTVSPFMHIHAVGQANIVSYATDKSLIHITPQAGDPEFTEYTAQQYTKAPILGGDEIRLKWNGNTTRSKEVGLEIGSVTDMGAKLPVARYLIQNVVIDSFYIGMQWHGYNHYLGTYENCQFEPNTINLLLGNEDTIGDSYNSGENFVFDHCLFSESETGMLVNLGGFHINMLSCSMDFNRKVFCLNRGYTNINYVGGHIENMRKIAVSTQHDQSLAALQLTNVVVNTVKDYQLFEGVFNLITNGVKYERTNPMTGTQLYMCDGDVIARETDTIHQTNLAMLSPRLNMLYNPKFKIGDDGLGGYTKSTTGITVPAVTTAIPSSVHYTQALHYKNQLTDGTSGLVLRTEKMPVKPGRSIISGLTAYSADANWKGLAVIIRFYNALGGLMNGDDPVILLSDQIVKQSWFPAYFHTIVPSRAVTCEVEYSFFHMPTAADYYIGEIGVYTR